MPEKIILLLVVTLACCRFASAELTDPTRPSYRLPGSSTAAPAEVLNVSAVFISGERRIAVVNGQRLREGDAIGGATIRQISQNRVSFERGGKEFSLSLRNGMNRR